MTFCNLWRGVVDKRGRGAEWIGDDTDSDVLCELDDMRQVQGALLLPVRGSTECKQSVPALFDAGDTLLLEII